MTTAPLPSQYDPSATEAKWQQWWEENQVFTADPQRPGPPYCIVIPPPNVTGDLHMGHAFNLSLIDVLVRYHRLLGYNTLCLPGTDHASIAVSTLLDRQLQAAGTSRQSLGRSAYLERAWEWKEKFGGKIVNQMRRLGLSADWSRERFSMDAGLSRAVVAAFSRLHAQGLIYRGEYLVNWCPASQSAIADQEIEPQEVNGHLWHLRYPLEDGTGFIQVATTRPETMFGDVAVAVHPGDERYRTLVGQHVILPVVGRPLPIIADEAVDPSFGSGCVKVTPAHDPQDFAMGKRHHLPMINIMNRDGSLNEQAGSFQGQDRLVARKNLVELLDQGGWLVRVEDYRHTVPYSDRGKVPVEPLLSTQWFVRVRPLAEKALVYLEQQSPQLVPERWTKVYRDWLVSLQDWCISRQLWWGHQIPAWYVVSETNGAITDATPWVVATTDQEAIAKAQAQFGSQVELLQDPDVLDTWFSSGLWPFSTLGWPESTPDLERYYPTSMLVTGFDILFFWVVRMSLMAGGLTGQMPFATVYLHGLVRDEHNRKMSKSAGNGVDPLELIAKYGSDALRYTLVREVAGAGQDIRLEYNRATGESNSVAASRNFINKLWNASRFVLMHLEEQSPEGYSQDPAPEDTWILSRCQQVIALTRTNLDHHQLGEAAKILYEFTWGDFCDWYLELVKPRLTGTDTASRQRAQGTLVQVLEVVLKLLHPFLPHVTEEVWSRLHPKCSSLAFQTYPECQSHLRHAGIEREFELIILVITKIRNLRAEAGIKPGARVPVMLQSSSGEDLEVLTGPTGTLHIAHLAKVEQVTVLDRPAAAALRQAIVGVVGNVEVLIPLRGVVDLDLLRSKILKDLHRVTAEADALQRRLEAPSFLNKAPAEVVSTAQTSLATLTQQREIFQERLSRLEA